MEGNITVREFLSLLSDKKVSLDDEIVVTKNDMKVKKTTDCGICSSNGKVKYIFVELV